MEGQVNSRETPKFRIQNNPSKQQRNVPLQVVEGVSQKDWGQTVWHAAEGYNFYMALRKLKLQNSGKRDKLLKNLHLGVCNATKYFVFQ